MKDFGGFLNYLSNKYEINAEDEFNKYLISINGISGIDPDDVAIELCNLMGASFEQLKQRKRYKNDVAYRHIILWYLNTFSGFTLAASGWTFGNDHSTVVHAKENIQRAFDTNDGLYMPKLKRLRGVIPVRYWQDHVKDIPVYEYTNE